MLRFPPLTPPAVRRAVRAYVAARRLASLALVLLVGVTLALAALLGFMLLDRLVELPLTVRWLGPGLVAAIAVGTLLAAAVSFARYRPRGLATAIELDAALPANADRWATSLDLAARLDAGEAMPARALIDHLLADAQRDASPAPAVGLIRLRALARWLAGLPLLLALGGVLSQSAAIDPHLLWRRFWHPAENLPRDADILLTIDRANNAPFAGSLPTIPENTPFELSVGVRRKGGWLELRRPADAVAATRPSLEPDDPLLRGETPSIELLAPAGAKRLDLVWRAGEWRFTQAGLSEPLLFRLRAADALSARYEQPLVRRIKLARVDYSFRHPRYTKIADPGPRPLDIRRLSALVGSRIEFNLECDIEAEAIDASFEPFQKSAEETKAKLLTREDLLALRGMKKAAPPQRRALAVSRPTERSGRFRIEVEETGLLRLSARGRNGHPSDELSVIIDAQTDAPPRITITGLDPETWVTPGETVAYQYRAEDDFAVADIVMSWKSAGVVTTFDFTGEEMIKSRDMGKRLVAGQELVQRLNYPNVDNRPLEFWLIAADSKGQEARTPSYKIYFADEDYAARVDRGLAHLAAIEASAAALQAGLRGLDNRMNVLAAVVGEAKRWPADKAPVLEDFLKQVRQVAPGPLDLSAQRVGGLPARIDRAAAILAAARSMLAGGESLLAPATALGTSDDLPKAMADLRGAVKLAVEAAELLKNAAAQERTRLTPESLVQRGLSCERRLVALQAGRANKELFEANRAFVLTQVAALAEAAKPWAVDRAEAAEPLAGLAGAAKEKDVERSLTSTRDLLALWMAVPPAPPTALPELQAWMTRQAAGNGKARAADASEALLASRGRAEVFEPRWLLALARAAGGTFSDKDQAWAGARPAAADVLLLRDQLLQELRAYRMDLLAGRYALQPSWSWDRAAELRELMLALGDLANQSDLPEEIRVAIRALVTRGQALRLNEAMAQGIDPFAALAGDAGAAAPAALLRSASEALAADGAVLAAAMIRAADEAEAHAAAIKAFAARTDRPAAESAAGAAAFQAAGRAIARRLEAIEAGGRALSCTWVANRLLRPGPAAAWAEVEQAHGQALSLTWLSLTAQEQLVDAHFARTTDVSKWPGLYAKTQEAALALAAELRAVAPRIEAGAKPDGGGTAARGDYAAWTARLNAGGHLETIRAEHEPTATLLAQPRDAKAAGAALEQIKGSILGQVVLAERLAAAAASARASLRRPGVSPAARAAELRAAAATLASGSDQAVCDALRLAARTAEAATTRPATRPAAATSPNAATQSAAAQADGLSERDRSGLEAALDAAVAGLSAAARPPAAKAMVASTRRNQSGIAALANLADRRWAQRLRGAEINLVRALLDAEGSSVPPAAGQALALQAARLWELRARNITQERRGNRGLSALAAEEVATIRLPRHIEAELIKARNGRSPEAFRDWIEAYYANLYRDLAP